MHAEILIGVYRVALAHDKPLEWPVALADAEFPAPGILEFVQLAHDYFALRRVAQAACSVRARLTTIIDKMIDGMPSAAAYRKNPNQPIASWTVPEKLAEILAISTDKELKSAYCVAVNDIFVMLERYAIKKIGRAHV